MLYVHYTITYYVYYIVYLAPYLTEGSYSSLSSENFRHTFTSEGNTSWELQHAAKFHASSYAVYCVGVQIDHLVLLNMNRKMEESNHSLHIISPNITC